MEKTPLYIACEKGDISLVEILINSGATPCDRKRPSTLYVACKGGNLNLVKLIFEADERQFCSGDEQSFFYAAFEQEKYDVAKYLLSINKKIFTIEDHAYRKTAIRNDEKNWIPTVNAVHGKRFETKHKFIQSVNCG